MLNFIFLVIQILKYNYEILFRISDSYINRSINIIMDYLLSMKSFLESNSQLFF